MNSEHLQNVRPVHVASGWLVAIAVTSLIILVLTAVGLGDSMSQNATSASWWSLLAVAVGFFVGGMFSGMRALQAPVLHGIAIGLTSLIVWAIVNAVMFGVAGGTRWDTLSANATVMVLVLQIVAAILGALTGYNIALRGKPGLSEHEPIS